MHICAFYCCIHLGHQIECEAAQDINRIFFVKNVLINYVEVLKEEFNSTSTYVPAQLTKDKLLLRHIDTLTKSNIKIDKLDLPTFYWLPKLHPPWGPGGLSRECILRIPMRVVKGD